MEAAADALFMVGSRTNFKAGMARLRPPGVAFRELVGPIHAVGVALAWNAERESQVTRLALDFADILFPVSGAVIAP